MNVTVHGFFFRSNKFSRWRKGQGIDRHRTKEQLLECEILRVREVNFLSSQKEQYELLSAILFGTRSSQIKKNAQVSHLIKALCFISLHIKNQNAKKNTNKMYYIKKSFQLKPSINFKILYDLSFSVLGYIWILWVCVIQYNTLWSKDGLCM